MPLIAPSRPMTVRRPGAMPTPGAGVLGPVRGSTAIPHCGQNRSAATSVAPQVRQAPTRAPHAPQKRSLGWRELPQLAHAYGVVIGLTGPVIAGGGTGKRKRAPVGRHAPSGGLLRWPESAAHHELAQESTLLVAEAD